jgi:hypothetical protein
MVHGTSFFAGLLALAVAGSSQSVPSKVYFIPADGGLVATPRPWKCKVEFLRNKTPNRPYEELGGLFARGSMDPKELVEELNQKACRVGAEALLITRDFATELAQHPEIAISENLLDRAKSSRLVTVGTMTGTAIRYRKEAGAAASPAPGACQFAFSVGKWSLCQLESSTVYVWWTGDGRGVSAKFPSKGKGEWFLRREEKVAQVQKKQCRGENNPACNAILRTTVSGESWEQPETAESASVKEETRFDLGETRFVLTEKQIQVELPEDEMVWFSADRAAPKMGKGTSGSIEEL